MLIFHHKQNKEEKEQRYPHIFHTVSCCQCLGIIHLQNHKIRTVDNRACRICQHQIGRTFTLFLLQNNSNTDDRDKNAQNLNHF